MDKRVEREVKRLGLSEHPEGGYYREVHRSEFRLGREALGEAYSGDRCAVTSILFLLPGGEASAWHRVVSEEIFVHHRGDAMRLETADAVGPDGIALSVLARSLGQAEGDHLQLVVERGRWQRAIAMDGEHGYALVGCIVAPGFDFDDFEMVGGE